MTPRAGENELIRKALMGDDESFEALLFSCRTKAYNLAFRYLKNHEDASDALQESFIKIYRNLAGFKGESSFDTWVYRIVVNTCNDMIKKNKSRPETESLFKENDEEYTMDIPDSSSSPEQVLIHKEDGEYIVWCLNQLPEEHREILILRDIQGFHYEEISQILNCGIGTVKSRISRARHRFREIYHDQASGGKGTKGVPIPSKS